MSRSRFNFLQPNTPTELAAKVRTRATARDEYAGLQGQHYIKASQLGQPVQRVQTSEQKEAI
jgi:hypothetical protein